MLRQYNKLEYGSTSHYSAANIYSSSNKTAQVKGAVLGRCSSLTQLTLALSSQGLSRAPKPQVRTLGPRSAPQNKRERLYTPLPRPASPPQHTPHRGSRGPPGPLKPQLRVKSRAGDRNGRCTPPYGPPWVWPPHRGSSTAPPDTPGPPTGAPGGGVKC